MAQDPMAQKMAAETPSADAWIELPGPEALGAMPANHPYNFGFIAAMYRLIGAHPRIGMAFGRLYARIMFSPGALTRPEREMVAGVAAAVQDCHYWTQSHAEFLRVEGGAAELVEAIKAQRWREVISLSARERSLCEIAEQLSAAPTRMTPADWQPLRDLGFDDLALLDVAYVVGVFNYLTRLADGFGLQLDRQVQEASKSQTRLRRIARDADVRPAEHDSRSDGHPDKPAPESDPARRIENIGMLSLATANAGPSQLYHFGYRSEMGLLLNAHPRIGPAFGALFTEVMFAPGSLSRAEREMIAATAAAAQDCHYWTQSHAEFLRVEGGDAELIDAIKQHRWRESPGLIPRIRALCHVAEKMSATPTRMTREDWQPLRDLGFGDRELLEVGHVVGIFNLLTRLADGFGLQVAPAIEEAAHTRVPLRRPIPWRDRRYAIWYK